jgi:hypothetical protein
MRSVPSDDRITSRKGHRTAPQINPISVRHYEHPIIVNALLVLSSDWICTHHKVTAITLMKDISVTIKKSATMFVNPFSPIVCVFNLDVYGSDWMCMAIGLGACNGAPRGDTSPNSNDPLDGDGWRCMVAIGLRACNGAPRGDTSPNSNDPLDGDKEQERDGEESEDVGVSDDDRIDDDRDCVSSDGGRNRQWNGDSDASSQIGEE